MGNLKFETASKEQVLKSVESENTIIVNVLAEEAYREKHIKGSVSIPLSDLTGGEYQKLDRTKKIITYCAGYKCNASREAAAFLKDNGFSASAYEGGMKEWTESGLPVEEGGM